ncbi:MAG: HlyD family efflux transporter periplasmic adaptor subunit [Myxococcota bacterium]|nr:HlyD family efflux transporter periplasmic adaptor subunit [Myxococcota bacterium]
MAARHRRWALWSAIGVALLTGLLAAFWPRSLPVDLVDVASAPLQVGVRDEGETRVVDVFVVSAPVTGRLRRVEAEPGDVVVAGETVLIEIEPTDPQLLDPRSEAEARAQLSAAESAESLARAEVERAEAERAFARSEFERAQKLARDGTLAARDIEASETELKARVAALSAAQATLGVRRFELERVRALLMSPAEAFARREDCGCLYLTSPIDGRVLRVLRESAGVVPAGADLVEIGDPAQLEIVVDLLSMDAVRVEAGQRALIENWGGERPLEARVRRVEPFGFTKVSALGIEEQRVNVVLDIASPPPEWTRLGHGYQVDVRIIQWEGADVLQVPVTALFRDGGGWAVLVRDDGRAARRVVELGHRNDRHAEIVEGLAAGDEVVVYPGEGIREGARIERR